MSFKSGFATIIGRTNVGKSTLVNKILKQKVIIVTDKPQTTRNKISAIYNDKDSQVVFLDTPGVHKPKNELSKRLMSTTKRTLNEVDVVIFMIDSSLQIGPGDKYILDILKTVKKPIILAINKIDLIKKSELIQIVRKYERYDFIKEIVGISALNGQNVNDLINKVKSFLNEGPKYYPQDMFIDQPVKTIVSEFIREKALMYLQQEVPHGVLVKIDNYKERENKDLIDIDATIICEKNSHKGIIIGKGGRKIKGIGKAARQDIEKLVGVKVNLQLWVKVVKNWRNNPNYIDDSY
ncbi:MAG: GTPase Era [Bacillota bacterium]